MNKLKFNYPIQFVDYSKEENLLFGTVENNSDIIVQSYENFELKYSLKPNISISNCILKGNNKKILNIFLLVKMLKFLLSHLLALLLNFYIKKSYLLSIFIHF